MDYSSLIKHLFAAACCLVCLCVPGLGHGKPSPELAIIPKPAKMEIRAGTFEFGPGTQIDLDTNGSGVRWVAEYLSRLLSKPLGHKVPIRATSAATRHRGAVVLSLQALPALGSEGYVMSVSPDAIEIRAPKVAGLFYGVQTLRQMLPPEIESGVRIKQPLKVQCVRIQDRPRFVWRGLMLDCSRTFISMAYLRKTVDRMALYKMNVLHLHLTDDQGWRLQIKNYPRLTTVGAHFAKRFGGGGGFYTQQQMRGLVAYAKKRNVTIVPEIEMPGHSEEVLAAYPELACPLPEKAAFEVHPLGDRSADDHLRQPLCVCNNKVFEMYRSILSQVIALFPSEYIHIGGDEVSKTAWEQSPLCQAYMKAQGLKDAAELQSYFLKRISKVIRSRGRRMAGWEDIIEGGLPPGAVVQSWRGIQVGLAAAKLGHDVVMSPRDYTYIRFTYRRLPTRKVYAYDPAKGFTPAMAKHILGVEGCMWTQIAITPRAIDFQLYPHLLALAETGWSPQQGRKWTDFKARLIRQFPRLQRLGVTYYDSRISGTKVGAWQASDLVGDTPHVLNWDISSLVGETGDVEVRVRWESGLHSVYVRSVEMLENGSKISHAVFSPVPVDKANDVEVGWLSPGKRRPGSRYTLRVTLEGTKKGASSGSVWIVEPSSSINH